MAIYWIEAIWRNFRKGLFFIQFKAYFSFMKGHIIKPKQELVVGYSKFNPWGNFTPLALRLVYSSPSAHNCHNCFST